MKLTADLINNSISHINPVGDRELILRGNAKDIEKEIRGIKLIMSIDLKIPAIENLGVTKVIKEHEIKNNTY